MVMRLIRRRNNRAERGGAQPPPVSHPSRTLSMTVQEGADHATRTIVFADEVWRANVIALDIEYLEADGKLLCRVNDAPPSSDTDVLRGDVRTILAQSYTEIRGPIVEHIGLRVQLQEPRAAGEGDFLARFQLKGWSQPRSVI